MDISSEFDLPLAPDDAYELLLDLDRVAPCLPGATLGPSTEEDKRELTLTVRLGPMRFVYEGSIGVSERDASRRRAVLIGAAREKRGQGTATGSISMEVKPAGDAGSRVESRARVELTGRAAQTGRGIVQDVSRQMIRQMADCLAARHAAASEVGASAQPSPLAPPDPQEIRTTRMLARVLWERFKRLLGRGAA